MCIHFAIAELWLHKPVRRSWQFLDFFISRQELPYWVSSTIEHCMQPTAMVMLMPIFLLYSWVCCAHSCVYTCTVHWLWLYSCFMIIQGPDHWPVYTVCTVYPIRSTDFMLLGQPELMTRLSRLHHDLKNKGYYKFLLCTITILLVSKEISLQSTNLSLQTSHSNA